MKTVNIALLGHGVVGSAFVKLFFEQKENVKKKMKQFSGEEIELHLKWIYHRCGNPPEKRDGVLYTCCYEDLLGDPQLGLVVELMGGVEPATSMMIAAMERGISVITANKQALYSARGGLEMKAKECGVNILYEASVAGAIPILSLIRESFIYDEILEIQGILNGSTNYILTLVSQGMELKDALKLANEKGYLEADPQLDLEGFDAMYKLGILWYTAYGDYPKKIHREGILSLPEVSQGNRLKLLARATKTRATVELKEIPPESPFYSVEGGANGILLKTRYGGRFFFTGAGAGGLETATAVLSDVVRLASKINTSSLDKEQVDVYTRSVLDRGVT